MVEKSAQGRWAQWNDALETALSAARTELAAGECQEAERRAKAVSAFAKAVRDAADLEVFSRTLAPEEDVEAVRAELRRRLARFAEADRSGASLETLEAIGKGILPR